MNLPAFALDNWLDHYKFADPPIEHDLASSTGPSWTFHELIQLLDADERDRLFETELVYSAADGGEELRSVIAEMQQVAADQVQIVTGASEAQLILLFLAAEHGGNVILPWPCFPPMKALAESFGLETRFYRLRRENGFRVELSEVEALVDRSTKLLLVNSPHNPTGSKVSDEDLRSLHDFATQRGIQFVSDEIYHPIYYSRETNSAARLPHATVIGGFSKALSLSGLRVGWLVERDPQRLRLYCNTRQYFTISNAALSVTLATLALKHRETIFARIRKLARSNLALLDKFFAEHSDRLGWIRPQGGTTAFPWLVDGSNARPFCQALAERGVLFVPGDCFGMAEHFRLGFGSSEQLSQALERFADFLQETRSEKKDVPAVH
ncbi:MAG TPA: aminotransferase class I/II-fold pyridoxal phosphate-dependent enzyme [Pyrinomonadaceae bacterium]|nr:aminotransferase class I/II-fold pyridoxal phosphate-dependent enzyme [Pyrinomonadaceae bacterium]